MKIENTLRKIIMFLWMIFAFAILLIIYGFLTPSSSKFIGLEITINHPKFLRIYNSKDPNIRDVAVPEGPSIVDSNFIVNYKKPNIIDIITYKQNSDLSLYIMPEFFCYVEHCGKENKVKFYFYDKDNNLISQNEKENKAKIDISMNEQFFEKMLIVIKAHYKLEKVIQVTWVDKDEFDAYANKKIEQ